MLDPLRTYDYLAISRQRVLDRTRPLSEEQYTRAFPIGAGTLARTFTHMLLSEWYYIERLTRQEIPPYEQWPIRDEHPLPFPTLETTWAEQAAATRRAFNDVRDWSEHFEYRVTDDDGRLMIVTTSAADLVTQLALHEVHHRAQALNMFRQLGVALEDLDFNALMMPRREATP